MSDAIINKVASSGLITLDLEQYLPKGEFMAFDLKDHLFMGLILKEKDFREALKNMDWSVYEGKNVYITCTADAVIPMWAYMLAMTYLQPLAKDVYAGDEKEMFRHLVLKNLGKMDINPFLDQRVVIKGCGDEPVENYAYAEIVRILRPIVKTIMYGEPCSTVPVFKRKE
ncbi:MAG TPA: DUF2480 family protein [Chitinophagaceae bacterium]